MSLNSGAKSSNKNIIFYKKEFSPPTSYTTNRGGGNKMEPSFSFHPEEEIIYLDNPPLIILSIIKFNKVQHLHNLMKLSLQHPANNISSLGNYTSPIYQILRNMRIASNLQSKHNFIDSLMHITGELII